MNMSLVLMHDLGWVAGAVALAGAAYALLAALFAGRFMRVRPALAPANVAAVTILKPLHGDEPGLAENLETFLNQDYPGDVQIVFGVHDNTDPALAVVERLVAKYPGRDICVVRDHALHGANGKVSNLINMLPVARHPVLILSDSDIAVGPGWLVQVVEALSRPGVGVVTCFYTGAAAPGTAPLWPTLAAMGTSYDFLPNALVGTSLALAEPCFGSTIALHRATLDKVGGFAAFADHLADDYEIGRAVRGLGYAVGLHTACIYPDRLESVLPMLDWVGFDVKAPFDTYEKVTGVRDSGQKASVCVELILASGIAHECRITIDASLLADSEILSIAVDMAKRGVTDFALQLARPAGAAKLSSRNAAAHYPGSDILKQVAAMFSRFTLRNQLD